MSISCFKTKCTKNVAFECFCTENRIFTCKKHLGKHQTMAGSHKSESLLKSLDDREREKFNQIASNANNFINEAIKHAAKSSASAIQTIAEETKNIIKLLLRHRKMIKKIAKLIKLRKEVNKIEFGLLEELQNVKDFLEVRNDDTKKSFSEYFNKLMLQKSLVRENVSNTNSVKKYLESEFFVFTKSTHSSEMIGIINLETLKQSIKRINYYTVNSDYSTICRISEEKVFVYGGWDKNNRLSDEGYIVDLNTCLAQKIISTSGLFLAGGTVKEGIIYIFGGSNSTIPLVSCQSYNLNLNNWVKLGNLPIASHRTSASCVNGLIYITGFQMPFILQYDEKDNSYSPILNLVENDWKYVFENFIVSTNYLYAQDDQNNWNRYPASWTGSNLAVFGSFNRGHFIYFMANKDKLFRINTKEKTLEQVTYILN